MKPNASGITATSNREGFHCGACHDGKRTSEGKTIFAACSEVAASVNDCARCHAIKGKNTARKYEYSKYTAKFPKNIYGVDWEASERSGVITPLDYLEGVSGTKPRIQSRPDFSIQASLPWVHPITFSHEKHSIWNGCELCHPEIFPTAKKNELRFSMFANVQGARCGACHGKVASPLNNCNKCHSRGPEWVQR